VLILLTDGANTSGEVEPLQATEFAAREGLRIYTVGVGADEMMVQDFFGTRLVNPSADHPARHRRPHRRRLFPRAGRGGAGPHLRTTG
jgi:hypothetical protein